MEGLWIWLGLALLAAAVRDGCIRIAEAIAKSKDTP